MSFNLTLDFFHRSLNDFTTEDIENLNNVSFSDPEYTHKVRCQFSLLLLLLLLLQDVYFSAGTLSPRRLPSTLCSLTAPREEEYSLPASTCFTPEGNKYSTYR